MRISRPLPIAVGLTLVLLTGVADATSTTCTTTVVCAEYINSSSGVAIHGEANTGIGIRGTSNGSTGFYGASRSGSPSFPGVEGESLNQTGNDIAGGFGLTGKTGGTAPAYGVVAYGSLAGGYGATTGNGSASISGNVASVGLEGFDGGGSAGNDSNVGVFGQSTHGTAVAGFANAAGDPSGVLGDVGVGILAEAKRDAGNTAVGVEAVSDEFPLDTYNTNSGVEVEISTPQFMVLAQGTGNFFSVDNSANVIANSLMTSNGPSVRTTGTSGTTRMTYSARTTAPVMEDFGEAQLVNGRGYVRLDPALSDVIDNRNAYHVFLTPEGDCNGLYVTGKSPMGFTVRELHGGRSAISFEYRILAKPVDDNSQRLALAPPLDHASAVPGFHRPAHAAAMQQRSEPFDPFARLETHLGPAAYARELKAARKIETEP